MVVSSSRSLRSRADRSRVVGSTLIGAVTSLLSGRPGGRPRSACTSDGAVRRSRPARRAVRFHLRKGAAWEPLDRPQNDDGGAPAGRSNTAPRAPASASEKAGEHLVARNRRRGGRRRLGVGAAGPVDRAVDQQVRHRVGRVGAQLDGGGVVGQQQHAPGAEVVEAPRPGRRGCGCPTPPRAATFSSRSPACPASSVASTWSRNTSAPSASVRSAASRLPS